MNQETVTYLTNIVIGVILAALMTQSWRQRGQSTVLLYWMSAAWIMTLADVLFAARPLLPHALGRLLPTLAVTCGHAVLLVGARHTVGLPPRWRPLITVVALHAAALAGFLLVPLPSTARMVCNGLVWGTFSVACALCLRKGSEHFWRSPFSPASAFLAHAAFHAVRATLAIVFAANNWKDASAWLQIVGDLEVSFFMVALFVGLLVAHLQVRHDELMQAKAEVETLSGLLPICAWCKKVRDDDGYWRQVEDYFGRHGGLKFTHGVCVECVQKITSDPSAPRQ
jgi:hypothetical protein